MPSDDLLAELDKCHSMQEITEGLLLPMQEGNDILDISQTSIPCMQDIPTQLKRTCAIIAIADPLHR